MLFHVSERSDIAHFAPRDPAHGGEPVVWAVDQAHLRNYLVPRECPRVTFFATALTSAADRREFLVHTSAVVGIEAGWVDRIGATTLYLYRFTPQGFECRDAGAGYFVSRAPVTPERVDRIDDVFDALAATGAHVQITENLWPLHDAVAASSLQFSMIRMRNALPRAVHSHHSVP